MDSNTEPASEAKERIESEAITYVKQFNWRPSYQDVDSRKDYIAGATAEYNRAQEEITRLKAELAEYKEVIKDLLPVAKHELKMSTCIGYSYERLSAIIDRAKKLIEK